MSYVDCYFFYTGHGTIRNQPGKVRRQRQMGIRARLKIPELDDEMLKKLLPGKKKPVLKV